MGEANTEAAMINNLREREVGWVDVEIALDHLQVWGDLAKEVIGIAIGQVTQTQDLSNLSRSKEFPKLPIEVLAMYSREAERLCIPWLEDPNKDK